MKLVNEVIYGQFLRKRGSILGLINDRGVVIREYQVGDSDKILTVFTEKNGKIKAAAKGAKSYKSRLIAGTQLLCYSDFVLYKGKELYNINSSQVIDNFYPVRNNIDRFAYGSYFSEFIGSLLPDNEPEQELLRLFLNTVHKLSYSNLPPIQLKNILELRGMCYAGYMPDLSACTSCGEVTGDMWFCAGQGSLVCEVCSKLYKNCFMVSPSALASMIHICHMEMKKVFGFTAPDKIFYEIDNIMEDYIKFHININYKSLGFLKTLR